MKPDYVCVCGCLDYREVDKGGKIDRTPVRRLVDAPLFRDIVICVFTMNHRLTQRQHHASLSIPATLRHTVSFNSGRLEAFDDPKITKLIINLIQMIGVNATL